MADGAPLSNTVGTVLDPIFSLRQRVRIAPGKSARVAFWTIVAPSRAELLDLIDKHHDRNAFDRAKTLAWTQAQVQLRHLGVKAEEAADFQRLAAPILYADAGFRRVVGSDRARRRPAVGAVAAFHLRRPADRPAAHRRDRGHRPGAPAAARPRVLAHEAAGGRPGDRQRARRLLRAGPADRDRDRGAQQPVAAALRRRAGARLGVRRCAPT